MSVNSTQSPRGRPHTSRQHTTAAVGGRRLSYNVCFTGREADQPHTHDSRDQLTWTTMHFNCLATCPITVGWEDYVYQSDDANPSPINYRILAIMPVPACGFSCTLCGELPYRCTDFLTWCRCRWCPIFNLYNTSVIL